MEPAQQQIQDATWQRIVDLDTLLKANDPKMAGHLKEIHSQLSKYEELVHLLTDDQIRQIISAQKQVTGTMLVQKVVKTKEPSLLKQARAIKAEDL